MIKKAFSAPLLPSSPQSSSIWKNRLCLSFIIVLILSFLVILFAWNMLCNIPSTSPIQQGSIYRNHNNNGSTTEQSQHSSKKLLNYEKRKVEIYYEVLCPDSRYFILKQFSPAFDELNEFITPLFIPYGKADTFSEGGKLRFECQHGKAECDGNMVHACAISLVKNEKKLTNYIKCMIDNNRVPLDIGKKCANECGVDWSEVENCFKNGDGGELLKKYGIMTKALRPQIHFIPTITVDGSQKWQLEILKDFKTFLCRRILVKEAPPQCS